MPRLQMVLVLVRATKRAVQYQVPRTTLNRDLKGINSAVPAANVPAIELSEVLFLVKKLSIASKWLQS